MNATAWAWVAFDAVVLYALSCCPIQRRRAPPPKPLVPEWKLKSDFLRSMGL